MKILELTNFSSGICGVWQRVKQESIEFSKTGHEVVVFSSNWVKGSNKIAKQEEKIGNIKIKRFSAWKPGEYPLHFLPGGESYMFWNFAKAFDEAEKFKPEVIISHGYRQSHNLFALFLAKRLNAKVFLVTHAPFIEGDITRSFWGHAATWFYNKFVGANTLKHFNKIITITLWEKKYLKKLGVSEKNLDYLPNGIPQEFFSIKKLSSEEEKILFFGRISPIKNLETLISALSILKNKSIKLEIVGPAEVEYLEKLKKLIHNLNLEDKIIFLGPIYDLKNKIKKIDSCKIFILPSKREAMPQALIETMARKKIVLASSNVGTKEIISDGKNGLLFKSSDPKHLAKKIKFILSLSDNETKVIGENAFRTVEKFNWKILIKKFEEILN